ncbi:MAG: hypothetical protein L6R38_004882 [Xanthoria sp. 2 TBL-2021]|nr:MAG: hypothetical protein L6R38_004882 [Xanthoria sp. 2 TBL-2021]
MTTDHDRGRFTFQQDWFELIRHEWEERTAHLRNRELRILEIGCFEGCSTTWILDNLMSHPHSLMTAIDTFEGGMEHQRDKGQDQPPDRYQLSTLKQRFDSNVAKCPEVAKLRVIQARSEDALVTLRQRRRTFNFIYIDASHVAIDVLHDAVLSWHMLEEGGTLVFDDYSWRGFIEDCYNPRAAVRAFVKCARPEVECTETESQLWVKRVPNRIPATPNPDPALYYWDKGLAKNSL